MNRQSINNHQSRTQIAKTAYVSMVAAGLGMFLAALDISVNVALPGMRDGLGADLHSIQWVIVVFVATRAGLVIGVGNLADRFGLRTIFIIGTAIYLASMICISMSDSLGWVVIFRITQAIGTGSLYAVSPAIASLSFSERRQGLAMGFTTGSQALGMLCGTIGAGSLMLWFPWESVFLFRVPFAIIALLIAIFVMKPPNSTSESQRLDMLGSITLMIGLCSLVIGLRLGRAIGWYDPIVVTLIILAPISLSVFWRTTTVSSYPVIPRSLLKSQFFSGALTSMFLAHMGVFVIWFVFPFYIADILERGALFLGVMLATMASVNTCSSLIAGYFIDKVGHKAIGVIGLSSLGTGLFSMAYLGLDSGAPQIGLCISLVGMGIGLFQSAAYYQVISNVGKDRLGTASGALSMAQSFGTVFSVATVGALFAISKGFHMEALASATTSVPVSDVLAFMSAFQNVFHAGTIIILIGALVFYFTKSNK